MTVETKAWKDMTPEERSAKMRAGKEAKAKQRDSSPDIDALVEAKVREALAGLRGVQQSQEQSDDIKAIAKKDPTTWTKEDREMLLKEHERLQAALEAVPFIGDRVSGIDPGTKIGDGVNSEYVAYTTEWFIDTAHRRKDRLYRNGRPVECDHGELACGDPGTAGRCGYKWPNYQLHPVVFGGHRIDWVRIAGVGFALMPGVQTLLPTPHYTVYMDSIRSRQQHAEQFQPPTPQTNPGYMHVNISKTTGGPVAVLLGKGALPDIAAREATDVPVAQ